MILQEQNFSRIVSGAFQTFKNLKYLDLSYCNVAAIDEFALDDNKMLDTIYLSGNSLEHIPSLFQSSDNSLLSLTLRHNMISSLDSQNMNNMFYLDVDYNLMTQVEVSQVLAYMPRLREVLTRKKKV